ncbi:LamG-like jellyroll fold domain-containing protein [Planctomycetota bacterium]
MYMKKTNPLVLVLALCMVTKVANADVIWGTPTNLGPRVNSSHSEAGVCISSDGLEFYFNSDRPGGYGGFDLWVTKRPTIEDDWGDPVNLGSPANSQYGCWEPSISSDGLSLYFSDGHAPQFGNHLPGGLGGQGDIWMITRETIHDAWGAPVNIGPAVNSQHATHPSISADGLSLYFQSHRPGRLGGHCDIMVATRESTSDSFGNPVFLKNVNSTIGEWMPDISADGRMLSFSTVVVAGSVMEIWVATRKTTGDDFGMLTKLPPQINVPSRLNASPNFSADGSTLYFMSDRPGGIGGADLYEVPIVPIVDFNGDYKVDIEDLLILIEHWGQDDPNCDIAPLPFGDGIVDAIDLELLMSHWGQVLDDPHFMAHWKLDESEGDVAYDSAGINDAVVIGEATWQPQGGQVNGALLLDGIDDYVDTLFKLNPAEGAFSVFAWVKGGAPGQVIVSQLDGTNWLLADPAHGYLMTDIRAESGRNLKVLVSETLITDGDWHRVGLVWDGTHRILYVDDIVVAADAEAIGLPSVFGDLNIGCDKNRTPNTFWSGMMDDVRIYDRVVTP